MNDIDELHLLVLNIGEAHLDGGWNFKDVSSPFTRIYYVTGGHAQIVLPEQTQDLREGYMYIIPAFTQHSYVCHEKFDHFYIHIYNESDHDILEDWDFPTEIEAGESMLSRVRRLHELCPGMELQQYEPQTYDDKHSIAQNIVLNKQRNLSARVESRGIIYQLLAGFLTGARPKQYVADERITKVLGYIRTHLSEKPNLDVLAGLCCISKDHLIRIFRREMDTTPVDYINRKKVERAQLRLITELTPVKEIAYQLGFDDQTYFNRIFKRIVGLTPTAYRHSIRR